MQAIGRSRGYTSPELEPPTQRGLPEHREKGAVWRVSKQPDDYFTFGLLVSLFAHAALVVVLVVKLSVGLGELPEPIVYSVSIEGGKTLGGISQVAKPDLKTELAPVKNVRAVEPDSIKPEPQKPDPKQPEPPQPEPEDDAEVSVAEQVPTRAPAKPTTPPQPTAPTKPTPAKATAVPTKPAKPEKRKSESDDVDKRLEVALQRYLGESTESKGKGFGAARIGGAGMGGGVVRPPEFFIYEKILKARIKDKWRWYDVRAALITQIAFEIEPSGEVRNVRVVKSSGDSAFDESVQRAVIKASPVPPPPASVYEQYFKSVRMGFDPRE